MVTPDVGRFDESLAWYHKGDRGRSRLCDAVIFAIGIPLLELAEGQLDEAVRWFRKSVSLDPGNPRTESLFSAGCSWISAISIAPNTGSKDRSSWAPEGFFSNLAMELLHLYRGDLSTALEYGRRAFETERNFYGPTGSAHSSRYEFTR